MKVLDLFSGIGGFSLGLERTGGFETVAFCEIDPFCRRVLAKHWPEVKQYEDVRTLDAATLQRDGIAIDVIAGGFPCQDLSVAGKRAGMEGARSGLWAEFARLIGELRPRYVLLENVPGLLSLGMDEVLGRLAALRYDAVWDCIPASALGAPHRRDRVWVVAHTSSIGRIARRPRDAAEKSRGRKSNRSGERKNVLADAIGERQLQSQGSERAQRGRIGDGGWWSVEPAVGRVAHGVPSRVDRIGALGNAIVPEIPELIGRAILAVEHDLKAAHDGLSSVQERK